MRVTGLGHASLYIETAAGSVLCDPWVSPAYFGSWFPFPDNSELDWDRFGQADYLYISHLHKDHFDPEHLRRYVSTKATVLLPDYPTDELHDALADLGFRSFIETTSGEPVEVDGLRLAITALVAPDDGPIGDSALALDDGTARLFNQNDAHPLDVDAVREFGEFDAHFLQFSGAIWWPMVYELPERAKREFARRKRARQTERALRYIDQVGARTVFPFAGPPCFLDGDLWDFNDLSGDDTNTFPDQAHFLDEMRAGGRENGRLLIPGSVVDVTELPVPAVKHPVSDVEVERIFSGKESYLRAYADRRAHLIEQEYARLPDPADLADMDILGELKGWWEPILDQAEHICAGVDSPVKLDLGSWALVIDFPNRQVREWDGESCRYWFRIDERLVAACVADHEPDWVNRLFLSMRFSAGRIGPYNEYVYAFFKCLTDERINYVEGWYARRENDDEDVALDGWLVQRRCPHLMADLSRFGSIDDGVLTCAMHGWQFDLATGKCLTSSGHELRSQPRRGEDSDATR